MQKSGILFFKKLCQKNVGFLLVGLMLVFSNNAMGDAMPYHFGSVTGVPNEHMCDVFFQQAVPHLRIMISETTPEHREQLEKDISVRNTFIMATITQLLVPYESQKIISKEELIYIMAVLSRSVFLNFLWYWSNGYTAPDTELSISAMCGCGNGAYFNVDHFNHNPAADTLPVCMPCEGIRTDQWTCNVCPDGFVEDGVCKHCPPAPNGVTVKMRENPKSVKDCYVERSARFTDYRGEYGCGAVDANNQPIDCYHPGDTAGK